MGEQDLSFATFPEYGAPLIDREKAETPHRVDLRGLPLDTIVEFHGKHPVSRYIAKLTEDESGRKIKIWLNREANCAIGPIDSVVSLEIPSFAVQKGVMEIGKNYVMPNFNYRREGEHLVLTLNFYNARTESYTKLFVQRPPS